LISVGYANFNAVIDAEDKVASVAEVLYNDKVSPAETLKIMVLLDEPALFDCTIDSPEIGESLR
jgi:hypothetical protein